MRSGFNFSPPQRILIDNRTGAALGRSVKLDGAYWRRHARQPVEFAKSVRTLADLSCKVLLEIGPQPVLTAAALRAWPDPATAPRAIASLRRNTADHRQITEAVADAYVLRPPARLRRIPAGARAKARPAHLSVRASPVLVPRQPRQPNQQQHLGGPRTEAVRLLEDGRIEELAALLDGASGDDQTLDVLTKACGTTQSTTHNPVHRGRPLRVPLGEIHRSSLRRGSRRGSAWILVGDDADAVRPLVDVLTARGHRHRIVGLPASDADEERLADALRAAAADDPTLRIVHVAALDADRTRVPSMRSLLRMQHRILGGTRRLFRAAVAAGLRSPIWVMTRGAQRVTDADTVSPDQTCLWGFGRAASLELPQVWGGLADLADGHCRRMGPVHQPDHDAARLGRQGRPNRAA